MALKAALEALKKDAAVWEEVAATTDRAGTIALGLNLRADEMSWAAQDVGLVDTYAAIQQKVAGLLGEGSDVLRNLSDTLLDVEQAYRLNDEGAARQLRGVWDVNE